MSDNYLTVTALTKYMKRKIDTDPHLKNIWLKGEISNFNHHSRGHMYLTVKDKQTRVQAVMFAGNNRRLKFMPENGMNVLIRGEINIFEPYGQYQLYIQQMEPDGLGSLYLAFEQLKENLSKKGFFDEDRKRKVPTFPKHIGIITSPTGAAVRDIITTIKRRYPIVSTTVIPVLVQGPEASKSIQTAIETANKKEIYDLLIVGRGGGSIEDLWSFNEESVAEAIFHSTIPIISAVGHETDITISDYVADLRAPTPTGAGELAVPSTLELTEKLASLKHSYTRAMNVKIISCKQDLHRITQSYAFRYPENLVKQKEQELDRHTDSLKKQFLILTSNKDARLININKRFLNQHPKRQVDQVALKLKHLIKQKNTNMSQIMDHKSNQLFLAIEKMSLLNPLEIMKRGFAIPYTAEGNIINSSKQVQKNDRLIIKMSDGSVNCKVLNIKEENNE